MNIFKASKKNKNFFSEEQYKKNINNGKLRFIEKRGDGFGARMVSLLNAMYCSKKFHIPFAFVWFGDEKLNAFCRTKQVDNNRLVGISVGSPEEVFTENFIRNYCISDDGSNEEIIKMKEWVYYFEPYRDIANFCFDDLLYYECRSPLGWNMPPIFLPDVFQDIDKNDYKRVCKECYREIEFSDEIKGIIEKVDTAVSDKGKFITIHVRTGDIVYSVPWPMYLRKALIAELVVEVIIKELPHNNVVVLGDDITSLERIIQFSRQIMQENNIDFGNHSILLAKDFIENNTYENVLLTFYDSYVLSKGEKLFISSWSSFAFFPSLISDTDDVFSCYNYFSAQEQYDIILKYIERLDLHPLQRSFSYYHLMQLSKELGKSFEEQLRFANKMVSLSSLNVTKAVYAFFLIEHRKFNLFYDFVEALSPEELEEMLKFAIIPWNSNCYRMNVFKRFCLGIFTADNARKARLLHTIKKKLSAQEKEWFNQMYKTIFFRLHRYIWFNKKLH